MADPISELFAPFVQDATTRAAIAAPETAMYCGGGTLNYISSPACWARSQAEWKRIGGSAAAVGAPTGAVLIMPPADGQQADQTITDLVNGQMRDQQGRNAQGVQTTPYWQAASGIVAAAEAADAALNSAADALMPSSKTLWLIGGAAALLAVALIARKQ